MLFLLMLSFYSEFEWVEGRKMSPAEISEFVKESEVVKRYEERNLEKWIIPLTSDIFKGGCKIVLSKGTQIRKVPEGLKIVDSGIKMKKFDRYVAIYEERGLKQEWRKLEREAAEILRNSSVFEDLSKILPEENCNDCNNRKEVRISTIAVEKLAEMEFPSKTYYSFIEIEEDRTVKLIPVVLEFCPLEEKINEYMKRSGGG